MTKQRKYSQLKEKEKSLKEKTMKQTSPVYQTPEFKKEVIKVLKELRKTIISRNGDHCNKELETIKRQ